MGGFTSQFNLYAPILHIEHEKYGNNLHFLSPNTHVIISGLYISFPSAFHVHVASVSVYHIILIMYIYIFFQLQFSITFYMCDMMKYQDDRNSVKC